MSQPDNNIDNIILSDDKNPSSHRISNKIVDKTINNTTNTDEEDAVKDNDIKDSKDISDSIQGDISNGSDRNRRSRNRSRSRSHTPKRHRNRSRAYTPSPSRSSRSSRSRSRERSPSRSPSRDNHDRGHKSSRKYSRRSYSPSRSRSRSRSRSHSRSSSPRSKSRSRPKSPKRDRKYRKYSRSRSPRSRSRSRSPRSQSSRKRSSSPREISTQTFSHYLDTIEDYFIFHKITAKPETLQKIANLEALKERLIEKQLILDPTGISKLSDQTRETMDIFSQKPLETSTTITATTATTSTPIVPHRDPNQRLIEVTINDRSGSKCKVQCSPTDTIFYVKQLAAQKLGGRPEKMKFQRWNTVFKDDMQLCDYEITESSSIELYYY